MKSTRWRMLPVIAILLCGSLAMIRAVPAIPRVTSRPPLPPSQPLPVAAEDSTGLSPDAFELPPLKAVLLVGPIDGDSGSWTVQEKENMDRAATELAANGVTVHKFYTPNNDWEQIY